MEDSLLEGASVEEEAVAVDSKAKVFTTEINYIKNDRIKESLVNLINLIPDYFFTETASSTGKYHPSFSQGVGGLVRHTKVAVKIANTLLINDSIGYKFTRDEKDLIILSLVMHDSVKRGIPEEKYTKVEHPLLASKFIRDNAKNTSLTEEEINLVCSMISSHMGQWNTDFNGNEVLPKPKTKYERFVHMCDYLSAQKFMNINFDENNEIIC